MSAQTDPRYMQLYRDYSKAIQGYQNALNDRKRVRTQLANKAHSAKESDRRPVGSPADFRIPEEPARGPAPQPKPSVRKVYMGPILGWAKLVGTSPQLPGGGEPDATFDVNATYDATSFQLYWNAKNHYEKCKRAFFDYVRMKNIDLHKQRAMAAVSHAANVQFLGGTGDEPLADAKREIDASCRNAWGLYQSAPDPKPRAVILLLLENYADAQLVGLESPTTHQIGQEVNSLIHTGVLAREK